MKLLKKFGKSESGTVSIEAAIVAPLMLWAFIATFVFWDIYYARSINMRAAYTLSDALSRETDAVDAEYMGGMGNVLTFLTKGQYATRMRVTTIVWDEDDSEFEVEWSWASEDSWDAQDTDTLADYVQQIPPLAKGDIAIVVETDLSYIPFINVGLPAMTMNEFVVTRPRFGPQLTWINEDGTFITADGEVDDPENEEEWDVSDF